MKLRRSLSLAGALLFVSAMSLGYDQLHLPTRRDAFMHVQYTTAGEFANALSKNPKVLAAMAKIFHTSPDQVVDYVRNNLHLDTLKETKKYKIWGRTPKGTLYTSVHVLKKGTKVWVAPDGTVVLRFVCSNPMIESLPAVKAPEPPQKPEPEPPKPEPMPQPEPPKPEPMPQPEPPKPEPMPQPEPPKPEPMPQPEPPKPEPMPQPEPPKPEPEKPMMLVHKTRPLYSVWGSFVRWDNRAEANFQESSKKIYTDIPGFGISADLRNMHGWNQGVYLDTTGYLRSGTNFNPLRFIGLGVQARRLLSTGQSASPYIGLGLGAYRVSITDDINQRFTTLGGRALLGLETKSKIFVELAYNYLGQKRAGRALGRLGVNAGFRF